MKKIEQIGNVNNDGILKINYRSVMTDLLYNHFRNSEVIITISKVKKKRSNQQNKYYWGVIVPCIQNGLYETQGEWLSSDAIHEFLKANFNYKELVNEDTGEIVKLPKSTTENDTFDFEEYQGKIRIFADTFLNVIIPLPNEQAEMNL